jgi:hypothetical protein
MAMIIDALLLVLGWRSLPHRANCAARPIAHAGSVHEWPGDVAERSRAGCYSRVISRLSAAIPTRDRARPTARTSMTGATIAMFKRKNKIPRAFPTKDLIGIPAAGPGH